MKLKEIFRGCLAGRWFASVAVLVLLVGASGCLGVFGGAKKTTRSAESAAVYGPDKCTRCHEAWSKRFDYYRGWDRYGCIFDGTEVTGYYDPWLFPEYRNTAREYYTGEWWDTPEVYAWPGDIANRVEPMSILSRGGLPEIPSTPKAAGDKVLVVAPSGGDFDSIQKAVDSAESGATVFVKSGTYTETVILKEGIRLIGQDPYTTIIDPKNTGHGIVAANRCLIAGFTLTGTGIDYKNNRFNAGIHVPGCDSTLVILRNIFKENGLFGILVEGRIDSEANEAFDRDHPGNSADYADRPYLADANPVIAGNTFYRIGQRAVFCIHARGEIFNNIFIGNVKTIGLERHARPFIHHNVFYLNNIPLSCNRSEPIFCNNIMYQNQWGQRMLKGSNPVIFGNVTWESPHFRDFDEAGNPTLYRPIPGAGEIQVDPMFVNPAGGDFHFKSSSTLQNQATGFRAVGIMRDAVLPQPPQLACEKSFGREVLSLTPGILDLIRKVDAEQAKVRSVEASYRIEYAGYLDLKSGSDGLPVIAGHTGERPAVRMEYQATRWTMQNGRRTKMFRETVRTGSGEFTDSGTIHFNGANLEVRNSRLSEDFTRTPDARFIGDRPFRETPTGIYRDYDQYYRGSIGTLGTFFHGYLRVLGGRIEKERVKVDGRSCIEVRYPHIGVDQYCYFYLDPAKGYRPMKLVQYYNGKPYRVIDSYRYAEFPDGVSMPLSLKVTDFAVAGPYDGKKVGEWTLTVEPSSLSVNGKTLLAKK